MDAKDCLANDDHFDIVSLAGTTATTTTMATDKDTPIERNHDRNHTARVASPPLNPLYTPIAIKRSPVPYADDTAAATTVQKYVAMEEATTSALVHAACRVHEAMQVVMNAFETMILQWTGLTPQAAAATVLLYDFSTDRAADRTPEAREMERAMMLQVVLQCVQELATATGRTAGVTVDARRLVASPVGLLPLSAFSGPKSVHAAFSAFTSGATVGESTGTMEAKRDGHKSSSRTMEDNIRENLAELHFDKTNLSSSVRERLGWRAYWPLRTTLDNASSSLGRVRGLFILVEKAIATENGAAAPAPEKQGVEAAARVRKDVQKMVNIGLATPIEEAATATLHAVELAAMIAQWKRLLPAWIMVTATALWSRVSGWWKTTDGELDDGTGDEDEHVILQHARRACQQAIAAVQAARQPVAR